jgi:DNA repair exonuclease SbcCD ATPase subunit
VLRSVTAPGAQPVTLTSGFTALRDGAVLLLESIGFALFDAPSRVLPTSGMVEAELAGALDGRLYRVRRSLDAANQWQVMDCQSGWLAASGAADVQHWLRSNFDIPEDQPLPKLFRDIVCFSIPASLSWLLEEPGLRERKLASLLRLDRYPVGLRWLDGVVADARGVASELQCALREAQGRDAAFADIQRRLEEAQSGQAEVIDTLVALRQQVSAAEAPAERFRALESELAEIEQDLVNRRVQLAQAQVGLDAARRWLAVHERAQKAKDERYPTWQEYEQASAEIGKLALQLADADLVRAEYQAVKAEILGLEREQALLQDELTAVRKAESAAADLAQPVQHQQQLEQQLASAHERAMRLELAGRSLQAATAEAKRVEVLLADVERQLGELEQLGAPAARARKLADELERQRQQLRDAGRQVDQLHFLEAAIRTVGGHLDELRRSSSVTERLIADAGNGTVKTEERTVAAHLRQAVDQQLAALERLLSDWRRQSRDLADAPQRVDQLRSTMHQLQQEIEAARQVEIKLGALPALKQQRKQLREHFDQLKKAVDAFAREQRECADAAALGAKLKQELNALEDPRAERQALFRQTARKKDLELALREAGKALDDRRKRLPRLEEQLAALTAVEQALKSQEQRRDQAAAGYREYLAQDAIQQLAAGAEQDVASAEARLEEARQALTEAEARAAHLRAAAAEVQEAPLQLAALRAQLAETELRAGEWQQRKESAAGELATAEENRQTLDELRQEVERHLRAERLLLGAQQTVRKAEVALGTQVRSELAERATAVLQALTAAPDIKLAWPWAEPPAVLEALSSRHLGELEPERQAQCVLALRLALALEASRFGVVFVSGLGQLLHSPDLPERVQQLPGVHQLLALPG